LDIVPCVNEYLLTRKACQKCVASDQNKAWRQKKKQRDSRPPSTKLAAFLNQGELAGATRRAWKAHMLRLLDWLEESETRGEWYAVQRRRLLKFLKGARLESEGGKERIAAIAGYHG